MSEQEVPTSLTLYDQIRAAQKCMALVSLALYANLNRTEDEIDADLLTNATELAWEMASETVEDLATIDLPRPVQDWTPATSDEELLKQLREWVSAGGSPLRRVAKAGGAR